MKPTGAELKASFDLGYEMAMEKASEMLLQKIAQLGPNSGIVRAVKPVVYDYHAEARKAREGKL